MSPEIAILCGTAAVIALLHTLLGPDHYLPFIVMSRARRWSLPKTILITALCGLGHVLSSVILGLIGVAAGIAVSRLESFEGMRGSVAAWLLIGFGFAYFIWGIRRALKQTVHTHLHDHGNEGPHEHSHAHTGEHAHVHGPGKRSLTPWILFTIFVFGPCEPLIPILMYPAALESFWGMVLVTAIFSVVTIGTMLAVVTLIAWGTAFTRLGRLERFAHALAGAAICVSGLAVQFLGL